MSIRKEEALRIMEALSGADEELLERSERTAEPKVRGKEKLYRFGKRYGLLGAACLCLLLVGNYYFVTERGGTESAAENAAQKEEGQFSAMQEHTVTDEAASSAEAVGEERTEEKMSEQCGAVNTESSNAAESAAEEALQETEKFAGTDSSGENVPATDRESIGCAPDERVILSGQEARELPVLGAYIPTALPDGYILETAWAIPAEEGQYESVSLTWRNALDSISWSVNYTDGSEVTCVEPEDLEQYDVNRYEIPYADSVPEKYREVFQEPVFREEDLSPEIIERRMKSVQDAGDTDTPRGRFSVLYEDGILVRFNGRGTVQEIWEMFETLQN